MKSDSSAIPWALTIHQLWLQLPPELEESEPAYQNLQPDEVVEIEGVKIIVGEYKGLQSSLSVPYKMTYLDVNLKQGEVFNFQTPAKQTTGFYPSQKR